MKFILKYKIFISLTSILFLLIVINYKIKFENLLLYLNDYKYENWVVNALRFYHIPGDLVVLISSSGQSANIINAAKYIKKNNIPLITLSGISKKNPLKNYGKINFYVDSKNYNVIELVHLTILLAIIESLIERKKLS